MEPGTQDLRSGRLTGLIARQLREVKRYEMEGSEEAGGPRYKKEMEAVVQGPRKRWKLGGARGKRDNEMEGER